MRLTPPTKSTFGLATLLLAVAAADRYFLDALGDDLTFSLALLGGALLWVGTVFNRI